MSTPAHAHAYVAIRDASKLFPSSPSYATLIRWHLKGLQTSRGDRIRLRTLKSGGTLFTTAEWAAEFLAAQQRDDSDCDLGALCGRNAPSNHTLMPKRKKAAADRSIQIGKDATRNIIVTGDHNIVTVGERHEQSGSTRSSDVPKAFLSSTADDLKQYRCGVPVYLTGTRDVCPTLFDGG